MARDVSPRVSSALYGVGRRLSHKQFIQPMTIFVALFLLHGTLLCVHCEKINDDAANLRRTVRQNVTIASPIGIGQIYVKHGNKTNQPPNSNYVVDTVYFAIEVPKDKKESYDSYNKPSGIGNDYKKDNYVQQNSSSYPQPQTVPYPPPARQMQTYNNAPPPAPPQQYGNNAAAQPPYQSLQQQQPTAQYGQQPNYGSRANQVQYNVSNSGADNDDDAAPNYQQATSSYTNSFHNKTANNRPGSGSNNYGNSYGVGGSSSTYAAGPPQQQQQQQYGQMQYVKCPPCITFGPPPPPPPPQLYGGSYNQNYAPNTGGGIYQQPQASPRHMAYSNPPPYNGPPRPPPPPPPPYGNNGYLQQQNQYMGPPPPPQYMQQQQQQPYYNGLPQYAPAAYPTAAPTTTTTTTTTPAPTTPAYKKVYSLYDRSHSQKLAGGNAGIYKGGVNYTFDMDGNGNGGADNDNNNSGNGGDNDGGDSNGDNDNGDDSWQSQPQADNGQSRSSGGTYRSGYSSSANQNQQPYRQQQSPYRTPPDYGGPPPPVYGPPRDPPPPAYGSSYPSTSNYGGQQGGSYSPGMVNSAAGGANQQQSASYGYPPSAGAPRAYGSAYGASSYSSPQYAAPAAPQGGYYGNAPPPPPYNLSLPGPSQSYGGSPLYSSPPSPSYSAPSYGAAPQYQASAPPSYSSPPLGYGGNPAYQQTTSYASLSYSAPSPSVMPSYIRGSNYSLAGSPAYGSGSAYSPGGGASSGVEFDLDDGVTEAGTTQIQGQPAQMASQVSYATPGIPATYGAASPAYPSASTYGASGPPQMLPGPPSYAAPPASSYQPTYGTGGLPSVYPAPYLRSGNYSVSGPTSYALPPLSASYYPPSLSMRPPGPYPAPPPPPAYSSVASGPVQQFPTGQTQTIWSIQVPSSLPQQQSLLQPYPAYAASPPYPTYGGSSYSAPYGAAYSPTYQVYPSYAAYPGYYATTSSTISPLSTTLSTSLGPVTGSSLSPVSQSTTSSSTSSSSTTSSTSTTSTTASTPTTTTSTSTSTTSTTSSTPTTSTSTSSTSTSTSSTSTSTSTTSTTSTTVAPGAPRLIRFPDQRLQQQLESEHISDAPPSSDVGDELSGMGSSAGRTRFSNFLGNLQHPDPLQDTEPTFGGPSPFESFVNILKSSGLVGGLTLRNNTVNYSPSRTNSTIFVRYEAPEHPPHHNRVYYQTYQGLPNTEGNDTDGSSTSSGFILQAERVEQLNQTLLPPETLLTQLTRAVEPAGAFTSVHPGSSGTPPRYDVPGSSLRPSQTPDWVSGQGYLPINSPANPFGLPTTSEQSRLRKPSVNASPREIKEAGVVLTQPVPILSAAPVEIIVQKVIEVLPAERSKDNSTKVAVTKVTTIQKVVVPQKKPVETKFFLLSDSGMDDADIEEAELDELEQGVWERLGNSSSVSGGSNSNATDDYAIITSTTLGADDDLLAQGASGAPLAVLTGQAPSVPVNPFSLPTFDSALDRNVRFISRNATLMDIGGSE